MKEKSRQIQLSLPGFNRKTYTRAHGGELARGKRKTARPFDPKQALHVVLRSSHARGELSMLRPRHSRAIDLLISRLKIRWNISIYRFANVGNHLHFLIRCRSRRAWKGFIRELAGGIAMIVTGARKGSPKTFWDGLVFTRIVSFGRDFDNLMRYLIKNLFESCGLTMKDKRVLTLLSDGSIRGAPSQGHDPRNNLREEQ